MLVNGDGLGARVGDVNGRPVTRGTEGPVAGIFPFSVMGVGPHIGPRRTASGQEQYTRHP